MTKNDRFDYNRFDIGMHTCHPCTQQIQGRRDENKNQKVKVLFMKQLKMLIYTQ